MGGGGASSTWAGPPGPAVDAAVAMGGIAVQIALGAACLVVLRRRAPGGAADLLFRVFAALAAIGGIHYLVAGSYYRFGDPEDFPRIWRAGLALAPAAFALALRPLGAWVASRAASESAGAARRVGTFFIVAALAGAGYGALFLALRADFAAITARAVAGRRAEDEAREAKRAEVAAARREEAKAREARGEPVPEELSRPVRIEEVEVAPEDVRRPFPIEVPLGACYLFAIVVAGLAKPRGAREITARETIVALGAGALALVAVWPLSKGITFS